MAFGPPSRPPTGYKPENLHEFDLPYDDYEVLNSFWTLVCDIGTSKVSYYRLSLAEKKMRGCTERISVASFTKRMDVSGSLGLDTLSLSQIDAARIKAIAKANASKLAACHTLKKTDMLDFFHFTVPQVVERSVWCMRLDCDKAEPLFEEVELINLRLKSLATADRKLLICR